MTWQFLLVLALQVPLLLVSVALWGSLRRARRDAAGIPIKLRRQVDVAEYHVDQRLAINETLMLESPTLVTFGTIEPDLVVTALDWPAGTIYVRPAR